jgi:hypothetical protein
MPHWAVDQGNGFAPVALAAEQPVAKLVVDGQLALAPLLQPGFVMPFLNAAVGVPFQLPEFNRYAFPAKHSSGSPQAPRRASSLPSRATTWMMGRSKALAKSQSRSSWAGTAMMAPVP